MDSLLSCLESARQHVKEAQSRLTQTAHSQATNLNSYGAGAYAGAGVYTGVGNGTGAYAGIGALGEYGSDIQNQNGLFRKRLTIRGTGNPGVPPPGGSPGDGPDNGSGGFDDTPIEDAARETVGGIRDWWNDTTAPGPSSQDELIDEQVQQLHERDYTRTGTDDNGNGIFTHENGQSTVVITRFEDGSVRTEQTLNVSNTNDPKETTTVTIGPDGTRTEVLTSFEYDTSGDKIGSTQQITVDGVETSSTSSNELSGGRTQAVWHTPEGRLEQIYYPDGRILQTTYDANGVKLEEKSWVQSSDDGNGGSGDTSNQNGNGNNSLTRYDESDIDPYSGSEGNNTGSYEEVGNSGISGAAG